MPKSNAKKTFVLIDSNAVIHRSYHALPPFTSPKGELVNAVYGYASLLLKVIRELKPDYIAACFDLAGPTFRHDAYKDYKATRVKAPDELYAQIPLVKKLLEAFHIPVFEKQGFEADDAIGTIAKILGNEKNVECFIVTGDMDTLQLVNERVRVYTLKTGLKETFIYGEKEVRDRFGIGPTELPDFKGLKGDVSDNIPGVPGIGDKTASLLLQKHRTLEKLYEALATIDAKSPHAKPERPFTEKLVKLLTEYKDQAFFSKELATINCDVPLKFSLEDARRSPNERESVIAIFRDLGFLSLLERLSYIEKDTSSDDEQARGTTEKSGKKNTAAAKTLDSTFYKNIITGTDSSLGIYVHFDLLLGAEVPRFLALNWDNDIRVCNFNDVKKGSVLHDGLKNILENASVPKYGHSMKKLLHFFSKTGMMIAGPIFDTEIAHLLTRSNSRDSGLPFVILQELGEEYHPAGGDAEEASLMYEYLGRLKKVLSEKMERQGLGMVYKDIEMPLIPILARMEELGIRIDVKKISKLADRFEKELNKLEVEIHALAGEPFNINSTKEMREVLFEKMQIGIKGLRKTAGGVISTQASELDKLKNTHPIIAKILTYREFFKIKTTYLDALPKLVADDGRLHTTYMQLGAATGRFSSLDPNLQNIPVRGDWGKEIRSVFIAEKGYTLLAADYSQLELRIVSHLAKDAIMQGAFRKGEDIHTRTAAAIFGVKAEEVTKDMRGQAKTLNFGVLYGMGPQAFSEAAGVNFEEAKTFIAGYFREFSGVKGYLDAVKADAEARGYVETLYGRRRYIPEMRSTNFAIKRAGERMAINMPVQGTEADVIKTAMSRIDSRLRKEGLLGDARLLLQVHDELVFEVRDAILKKVAGLVKTEMESVATLDVPLTVDCKAGESWGEMEMIKS